MPTAFLDNTGGTTYHAPVSQAEEKTIQIDKLNKQATAKKKKKKKKKKKPKKTVSTKETAAPVSITNTQKELLSGSSVTVDKPDGTTTVERAARAVLPGTETSGGSSVQKLDTATAKAVLSDPLSKADKVNIQQTFEASPEYRPTSAVFSKKAADLLSNTAIIERETTTSVVATDADLNPRSPATEAAQVVTDAIDDVTDSAGDLFNIGGDGSGVSKGALAVGAVAVGVALFGGK